MSSSDDFLQQLRATFREEADEHLQVIGAGLLQLERVEASAQRTTIVEDVFRAAHSLKGAARAVEMRDVESACQLLEDTFAAWKRQESEPTAAVLDKLQTQLTRLAEMVGARYYVTTLPQGTPAPVAEVAAAVAAPSLHPPTATATADAMAEALPEPLPAAETSTVRVSIDALHARLLETEEMLAVKLVAGQRVTELRELSQCLQAWRAELAASGTADPPEQLPALERKIAALAHGAEQDRAAAAKLVDKLVENSKKLLLLPFATISAPLPRLVRDLCRDLGKEADLEIEGENTVLDKQILDALKDPLIHLLRNCLDHGIEAPAERVRRGKPTRARLRVAVHQLPGNRVQIKVSDDGAGIDAARLKASAVKEGAITAAEAQALTQAQVQALIFRSGVSTSPVITKLSGRGLGLAIVQEKACRLGGEVSVESRPGAGTSFGIVVPAMRATFRGILVQAAGRLLVLPTTQVERATRARADALCIVEGRGTLLLDGQVLPVVSLAQVLELADPAAPGTGATDMLLVIAGSGGERVAFSVDQVLDEQEFLVKPLLRPLLRVRNVASATVLPTGSIAFILHVGDLLQSARRAPAAPPRPADAATAAAAPAAPQASILVAEDSITSRMLIKSILESAGYRVTTALDGMDALDRLRSEAFDLVVSDVEMPRLNGFDLTARIRAERKLAELPVVLVTAQERREDRERGVDVGADAYIVKSSFDQSTLVETVRQLL